MEERRRFGDKNGQKDDPVIGAPNINIVISQAFYKTKGYNIFADDNEPFICKLFKVVDGAHKPTNKPRSELRWRDDHSLRYEHVYLFLEVGIKVGCLDIYLV